MQIAFAETPVDHPSYTQLAKSSIFTPTMHFLAAYQTEFGTAEFSRRLNVRLWFHGVSEAAISSFPLKSVHLASWVVNIIHNSRLGPNNAVQHINLYCRPT